MDPLITQRMISKSWPLSSTPLQGSWQESEPFALPVTWRPFGWRNSDSLRKPQKHFAVFKFICLKWNEFTPSMLPHLPRKWNGWLNKTSASIFISCFLQNSRCLPFQQSQCLQCLPISRLCQISPRAHCRPTSLLLGDPICQQISFGRRAYNIMKMKGFWLCQMFGLTPCYQHVYD